MTDSVEGAPPPTPQSPQSLHPWRFKEQHSQHGPEIHVQIWRTETKSSRGYFHTDSFIKWTPNIRRT